MFYHNRKFLILLMGISTCLVHYSLSSMNATIALLSMVCPLLLQRNLPNSVRPRPWNLWICLSWNSSWYLSPSRLYLAFLWTLPLTTQTPKSQPMWGWTPQPLQSGRKWPQEASLLSPSYPFCFSEATSLACRVRSYLTKIVVGKRKLRIEIRNFLGVPSGTPNWSPPQRQDRSPQPHRTPGSPRLWLSHQLP